MEEETTYDITSAIEATYNPVVGVGDANAIGFIATVWKVSTLADGGIRLVLDLEEKARNHMPFLAECQQNEIALRIEAKKLE